MKSRTVIQIGVALLSAALLVAAFPPFGETSAIAVAVAPLLVLARLLAPRRAALMWFIGGFAFWFATLAWMPAICKNNGPWPLVVLGWAGLAALCAGYFALCGGLTAVAWRHLGKWALALEPIFWAQFELIRAHLFTGFAWNFLGTAVGAIPGFAFPARWGGVYLVSAVVVMVNGVFATLACRLIAQMRPVDDATRPVNRWARAVETAVPLLVALIVMQASHPAPNPGRKIPLRVALVQRNAPCIFSRAERENPYDVYDRLMTAAFPAKPHLTVWGESSMAEFGSVSSDKAKEAGLYFARKTGGALLAGGDHVERLSDGSRRVYNAAALYTDRTNMPVQIYAKQHLVPFGEYIPLDKWITPLQKLSPIGVSLYPGKPDLLSLPVDSTLVQLAPLICFEDTDPDLARTAARQGAQAIVLITNDSWFSHSFEPVQHAEQAVLRAIETGLPVIRTGNSGVTGVIFPSGRARWLSEDDGRPLVDAAGCQLETVVVEETPIPTPYTRFGDLPLHLLFAASIMGVLMVKYRHEKN